LDDEVLLVDASPANSASTEYPSGIPMPVMIVGGEDTPVFLSDRFASASVTEALVREPWQADP